MAGSFLTPIASDSPDRFVLWNARTDRALASRIEAALDSRARNKGLLGRQALAPGAAMILAPCNSIHSLFMRFSIDVAFVDRGGVVVKVVHTLRPWRVAGSWRAFAVIELPSGTLAATETSVGDRLLLRRQ